MIDKNQIKKLISSKLRKIRKDKDYSLSKSSTLAGIDITTLSRYEQNKGTMILDTVIKLLDVYEYDIFIFFDEINANMH